MRTNEKGELLVTIYGDENASAADVKESFEKLMYGFPNLNKLDDKKMAGFLMVFMEAVEYAGMTKQQLKDATMHCICNKHQYGDLQITDIVNYTKEVKLHDYKWYTEHPNNRTNVEVNGQTFWVDTAELALNGFKVVNKKIVRR